jgi:hypothetical protein
MLDQGQRTKDQGLRRRRGTLETRKNLVSRHPICLAARAGMRHQSAGIKRPPAPEGTDGQGYRQDAVL